MPNSGEWSYRCGTSPAIVEICELRGRVIGLPAHFHDEDQATLVLAGRRRFVIGGMSVTLAAGDIHVLPAGTAHASLPEDDALCRNLYLSAGLSGASGFASALARWREAGGLDEAAFDGLVPRTNIAREIPAKSRRSSLRIAIRSGETVAVAAARAGMSREGFSRAFLRQTGLPPRSFRILTRLNAARALLRAGDAPAAVAAAVGFADQSHLGRTFRHVFGVTPGQYRVGTSRSFQTARDPAG